MAIKVITERDTFQNGRYYDAGSALIFTGEESELPKWMKPVGKPSDREIQESAEDAAKRAAAEDQRRKDEEAELARLEAEEEKRLADEAEEKRLKDEAEKAKASTATAAGNKK